MDSHNDDLTTGSPQGDDGRNDGKPGVEYAGFWIRFLASILDSILATMVVIPLLLIFYDMGDFLVPENLGATYYIISYGFPFVAFVLFWKYRSATPGKIWMDIYIVDADTFGHPSTGRLITRYLGYYVSTLPLLLGFIWVAFDKRKQGFHDKIANTVVIKGSPDNIAVRKERKDDVEVEVQPAQPRQPGSPPRDPWKE